MDNNKISTPLLQKKTPAIVKLGNWLSLNFVNGALKKSDSGIDMLDIGCGYDAELLNYAGDKISHGVGIDSNVSDEQLKEGRFSFLLGDAAVEIDKLKGRKFDLITTINFMEHLPDPLSVAVKIKPLLKPGGKWIVLCPTWFGKNILELLYFKLGLAKDCNARAILNEHKMYYNKKDLWLLMVKAGFLPSNIHLSYKKFGMSVTGFATN